MVASVFISYSRRNRPFAERLQIDLRRSGLTDVWLDLSDIPPGEDFESRILPAIAGRSHLVLLASPEANASPWVHKEVNEARRLGKQVVPLRLAGKSGSMDAEWEKLNMVPDAGADYGGAVRKLAKALGAATPVRSVADLLDLQQGSVADAVRELHGEADEVMLKDRRFVKLPVAPSAYGMTWLFAPADARLHWPESLGMLFNFTSDYPGARHKESLTHWMEQVGEPWLVMVEGPVNHGTKKYELNADQAHEWVDSIRAGEMVIERFAKGRRRVGYYFNCLLPLAFEIGLRSTMVSDHRRVYHYNTRSQSASGPYELAYDGWK